MEKFKETLNKRINEESATYAILFAVLITVIATVGIFMFINSKKDISTASLNVNFNDEKNEANNQEEEQSIENLTSVDSINSVDELKKLNEKEVEEAKKKEKKAKTTTSKTPEYYIKVNYKAQVVTVYTKDKNGKFTKPVKAMVCSTGTHTPTSGVYKTPNRFRWLRMIGGVYSQYCTQIVGDILFHSVPYLERGNHASLEYWAYDKLGTRASLGCIRLTCKDAKWIYDNCKLGTKVEFYSSSNPGPLGKPTARKISSAPSNVRGWDPTDPARGNPWPKYLKEKNNNDKKNNDKKNDNRNNENTNTTKPSGKDDGKQNEFTNEVTNEITNEFTNKEVTNETDNKIYVNDVI